MQSSFTGHFVTTFSSQALRLPLRLARERRDRRRFLCCIVPNDRHVILPGSATGILLPFLSPFGPIYRRTTFFERSDAHSNPHLAHVAQPADRNARKNTPKTLHFIAFRCISVHG